MTLQFYNTLTRKKEPFEPRVPGKVGLYSCGPTVYQTPSIGNYRSFLLSDLIRRVLEYRGFAVTHVMNITDVGHITVDASDTGVDRIAEQAKKEGKDPWAIARHYEEIFKKDLATLHCLPAHHYPRATEFIPQMLEMVEKLVANGHAYVVNGNVYYDVQSFDGYGRLSNNTLEQLVAGARIEVHPEKRHPADFALWKQDAKHVMQWKSPWGMGFPGWHIECSAMSRKYLGDQFDIHSGGEDLVFPHHECEIAQSEGFSGKRPVVRTWLHNSFLLINGGKMSKSLGNVVLVEDVLKKGYNGRQLRFALMRVNYRMPLNFTWEGMEDAASALARLDNFVQNLKSMRSRPDADSNEVRGEHQALIHGTEARFQKALDDDLNISAALAEIFDLVSKHYLNISPLTGDSARFFLQFLEKVNAVLGILDLEDKPVDAELQQLMKQREEFRKAKDWKSADGVRDRIAQLGFEIVDTVQGPQLRPKGKK